MPKKSISSLELAALVNELQFLANGKISQIYHPESNVLLLQLHASGRGKQLLKIISGKWLCLTQQKESALKPSSFCMQLRKYIDNAIIKKLYQKDSERAVILEKGPQLELSHLRQEHLHVARLESKGQETPATAPRWKRSG
mgnify:CR=1 FL=1